MKFGILCNFYGFPYYIDNVLKHWQNSTDCIFAAASCKFDQYLEINYVNEDKDTIKILKDKYSDIFPYIYTGLSSNDSTVRNHPLKYLLSQNVDYIWLLDQDEFYSYEEIERIKDFVRFERFVPYFKINFKNYFNNEKTWLDGFCPPRIFKVKVKDLILDRFYFENDVIYKDQNNNEIDYKSLSYVKIPTNIAHIKHYSWCGDKEFLKNKVKYQNLRYNGICSYVWNEQENQLSLNEDFYKRFNLPKPILHRDS
jgi:hypothetical protein